MQKDKLILDIRYFGSKTENVSGTSTPAYVWHLFDFPGELNFWSDRIARKLREKELKIASFDHIYVNYTTVLAPDTIQLSPRDTEHWYKYIDYGIDLESLRSYSPQELENFVKSSTFKILRFLCMNDPEKQKIITEVEQEIYEKGIEIEIECKRKETKSYIVIISYKIAPIYGDSLGLINYIDKKSGQSFKEAFLKLQSYEDIYPLIDSISVKEGTITLKPRKSFKASLYTERYKVPIEIDFKSKLS